MNFVSTRGSFQRSLPKTPSGTAGCSIRWRFKYVRGTTETGLYFRTLSSILLDESDVYTEDMQDAKNA